MLLTILLLPLLGFLSGLIFGKQLGKGIPIITTTFTSLSFILSFVTLFNNIITGNTYMVLFKDWIYTNDLIINWGFCFDSLTSIMIVVVTFISSLVHLYSTEYMQQDPHLTRFMSYLSLFTFFMLILVTADNFLQMFVGWEGVGLSSYLLINFWFTRIQANKAAIKAMLVNRVGDFFLLLGMFAIFINFGSLNYDIVFNNISQVTNNINIFGFYKIKSIDLICLFLFLGAMGKSAQIGLHTWLPDAMEGPTPVSALIHAATMVTAGVFLLCRCSYLFEHSSITLAFVTIIGAMTAFFAATTGLFQNDMKKVIAYSTCSQLGYMIFACGLSSYEVGMFHLSNHAFFKALLFLGAGAIIHAVSDEQDMRKMGGLQNILPYTYSTTLIGSLALIGFPFLAGFYSKDIILEASGSIYSTVGLFSFILGIIAAFCTAFYSTRLLYLVFLSNSNGNKNIILNSHEGHLGISLPLFLLTLLSISIGYLSKDLFIGFGNNFWESSIFILPQNYILTNIEFLELKYKLLPLFFTIFGSGLAFWVYIYKINDFFLIKKLHFIKNIFNFFNKKWFFDRVYNQIITQTTLKQSHYFFYQNIDRGILEILGPSGLVSLINLTAKKIQSYQTGYILTYLSYFLISIILFSMLLNNEFFTIFLLFLAYTIYYFFYKSK